MMKMTNAAAALLSDGPDRNGENCRPGRHRRGAVPIGSQFPTSGRFGLFRVIAVPTGPGALGLTRAGVHPAATSSS